MILSYSKELAELNFIYPNVYRTQNLIKCFSCAALLRVTSFQAGYSSLHTGETHTAGEGNLYGQDSTSDCEDVTYEVI